MKKNTKGFTLIELMLCLLAFALMMVAAFMIYEKVSIGNKVKEESNQISLIVSAINSAAANKPDYEFLRDGTFLVNSQTIPRSHLFLPEESDSYVINAWGGALNVSIANYGANLSTSSSYSINETEVPASACPRLVSSLAGSAQLISVGTMDSSRFVLNRLEGTSLDMDNLVKWCNINNSDPVNVKFIYY